MSPRHVRRVFGFRLVDKEVAGLPLGIQAHFIDLTARLAEEDVPADDVWEIIGHRIRVHCATARNRTYRIGFELMAEGWIMVWACGGPTVFRRRLTQRLHRIG
jgi:hypothetical protein